MWLRRQTNRHADRQTHTQKDTQLLHLKVCESSEGVGQGLEVLIIFVSSEAVSKAPTVVHPNHHLESEGEGEGERCPQCL